MANLVPNTLINQPVSASYQFQPSLITTPNNYPGSDVQVNRKNLKKKRKIIRKDNKCFQIMDRTKSSAMKSNTTSRKYVSSEIRTLKVDPCSVCKKKKCFKHLDQKINGIVSKKTPEETVLQIKRHMVKLLSLPDFSAFYKDDVKHGQLEADIGKMHKSYIEEHEPLIAQALTSSESSKDTKPKVKLWLYRKIFLDEFQSYDYLSCKQHLCELRRNIETAAVPKKKRKSKAASQQTVSAGQNRTQDFSSPQPIPNGVPDANSRTTQPMPAAATVSVSAPSAYQAANLMSIGVDSNPGHLGYMSPQVTPNLLFNLSSQSQLSPMQQAQQQPLNLQTSHQAPSQHLPINLHNPPYYVSFAPMLPIHVQPQQHPQQFQQLPHQSVPSQGYQHAMYQ